MTGAGSYSQIPSITAALISGSLLFGLGCGSESAYPIVPVTGVVKYDDGTLIPPRPGLGEVDPADGSVTISTYDFGDGLIRGKHKVTAQALDEKNQPTKAISRMYLSAESTPLEVDTEAGSFELMIKKP